MREDKARDLIVLILFRRGKTIKYPLQKIKLAKTPLQVKINGHQCNFTIIIWTKKKSSFYLFHADGTPDYHPQFRRVPPEINCRRDGDWRGRDGGDKANDASDTEKTLAGGRSSCSCNYCSAKAVRFSGTSKSNFGISSSSLISIKLIYRWRSIVSTTYVIGS